MLTAVVSLWYPSGILIKRDWLPLSGMKQEEHTSLAVIHDEVGHHNNSAEVVLPSIGLRFVVAFSGLYSRMAVVRGRK